MKYKGSNFEYKQERAEDLMRAYHQLINDSSDIHILHIYRQVVNMPASRFWISEERAAIVIGAMVRGKKNVGINATKAEMYNEIYRRAKQLMDSNPKLTIQDVVSIVVMQPAPKFYISSSSAKAIIQKAKKKWYEQRKKKLKHLFY